MQKERFLTQRKSKLQPKGDGPFQVLERINDNAYKLDFPSKYGNVSATFNVANLSLFDKGDLRIYSFEEGIMEIDVWTKLFKLMRPNIHKILCTKLEVQ